MIQFSDSDIIRNALCSRLNVDFHIGEFWKVYDQFALYRPTGT